jgi:pyridoxine 4-dehydrogenase
VLADLQREGIVKHLGLSTVTPEQRAEAQSIAPVVCVQNFSTIANREDDPFVDDLAEQGIAYVPCFPLGGFTPSAVGAESGRGRRARHASPQGVARTAKRGAGLHAGPVGRRLGA